MDGRKYCLEVKKSRVRGKYFLKHVRREGK
jgi:hypothetical protein